LSGKNHCRGGELEPWRFAIEKAQAELGHCGSVVGRDLFQQATDQEITEDHQVLACLWAISAGPESRRRVGANEHEPRSEVACEKLLHLGDITLLHEEQRSGLRFQPL
jgi:hypothetical protein